jgi:glycosyltransferase involved in cell wall biosynthesis
MQFVILLISLFASFFSLNIAAQETPVDLLKSKELPSQEIAVVQLSFDGVNTYYSGVGTVVLQTQTALEELNQIYLNDLHFKLYLLAGDYSHELPEYSKEHLERNERECAKTGGKVCLLPLVRNNQAFGEPEQWQELCTEGAKQCVRIINENEYTIVLAHDTAYARLPLYLKELDQQGAIHKPYQVIWIPHATSWKYNGHTEDGTPKWPERHEWELEACRKASQMHYLIGYISETIKNDLRSPTFDVPEEMLIPYRTGILLDHFIRNRSEEEIVVELKKRNIPLDKQLIFSIGRAVPLKGQDITLEMYRQLKRNFPDLHLVMLAPISDYMPSYLQLLRDRIEKEHIDVTLLDTFDAELAPFIYQWPNTVLVSLLSRMDTQPVVVMEARANPKNCVILTSDPERMGNQVIHRKDGLVATIEGLDKIITGPCALPSMTHLVTLVSDILDPQHTAERATIVEEERKLIEKKYDFRKNLIRNLALIFSLPIANSCQKVEDRSYELTRQRTKICDLYNLSPSLEFEELSAGCTNPPILAFIKDPKEAKIPLGIFKSIQGDLREAEERLRVIYSLHEQSFPHVPNIFKTKTQEYIVRLQGGAYSFMEYLPQAQHASSFNEILKITGKLHEKLAKIKSNLFLKKSKLDEYQKRSHQFLDPWLRQYHPDIAQDPFWNYVCQLNQYFSSEKFRLFYDELPAQLIHGDNNQTNLLVSCGEHYWVDFDTIRHDVRLLDLVSYFRYGGFDEYIRLVHEGILVSTINALYGKEAGSLNFLEERVLHSVVMFSHIEFMSWALERLQKATLENDQVREAEFKEYLRIYIKQLRILKTVLEEHYEKII